MRILLATNASCAPPRGGATRSNLVWLNHLAKPAMRCRIVCGPPGAGPDLPREAGIAIEAVAEPARRMQALRRQIREFQPDWVLVSSEDLGHALLREAHHSAEGRVVYLAHTPQFFPFGPASWNPERHAAELAGRSAGIVAIGRHMAGYIERASGTRRHGDPSADLRQRPVRAPGELRARVDRHVQSVRGEGHLDLSWKWPRGSRRIRSPWFRAGGPRPKIATRWRR